MSGVTIETLRVDFEAAHAAVMASGVAFMHPSKGKRTVAHHERHTRLLRKALRARTLLQIAEKYGLKAAMLYKLTDGAIDPRLGG